MESLILANEAAVAEIRKHAKADDKNSKAWPPKTGLGDISDRASKPSITSTGIVRELVQQTSGQMTNKTGVIVQVAHEPPNNLTKNDGSVMGSLVPVPVVFPSLTPKIDDSKGKLEASVQDRAHVINQLLALWSPEVSTIIPIDGVTEARQRPGTSGMEKMTVGDQVEETVDLFPRRSQPY